MESGGKLQFVLLAICLQIFKCSCSSLTFEHRNLNTWEILIGANENEFLYDFCRYDASENIERCKNKASATVDMKSTCNCTVNDTAIEEEDSVYFTVNCNNETLDGLIGACPQKLTIIYEHGDVRHLDTSVLETPTATQMQDESSSFLVLILLLSLLILSLVTNVAFGVVLYMLKKQVSTLKMEKKQMKELLFNKH
ncbi:uncharacterized protein LOC135937671 isoform X2 [Cloeon dipterum]